MVDLGTMALTGKFPAPGETVPSGPLELVRCKGCGLVQLAHEYDPDLLYGPGYGYRSGLNASMVRHLQDIVARATDVARLAPGHAVVDIGSNDGTLLNQYRVKNLIRVGVDPLAGELREHYPASACIFNGMFDEPAANEIRKIGPARIVTSIAMFYDLPDPVAFARRVMSILEDDGIWVTEQAYLPAMCENNAYDSICHEHLEYYTLTDMQRIANEAGAQIIDCEVNEVNGGSFIVTFGHRDSEWIPAAEKIEQLREAERPFKRQEFYTTALDLRAKEHGRGLHALLTKLRKDGKTVLGYGASTKGNVVLQNADITPDLLPAIAEVNADKFGRVTPGTGIPIISEAAARAIKPDYFLVLPWHFRDSIIEREHEFLGNGGRLIFPLPQIVVCW